MNHCDLRTGLCGEVDGPDQENLARAPVPKTTIFYATDPICSHCWAMEPAWRKLLFHYGDHVEVRHIYGGLLPRWEGFADSGAGIRKPADVAPHWEEVARHYGQPINPSVWLDDPLESSYPPSNAVHTVRQMDPALEEDFLRRIRQAVFLEGRNIARTEVLAACAADVSLDARRFAELLDQGVGKAGFKQDLQEVRRLKVYGFPTLIVTGDDGRGLALRGTQPYDRLEQAVLQVTGLPRSSKRPPVTEVLAAYGTGTTREFAEILETDLETASQALTAAGAVAKVVAGNTIWSVV